MGVAVIPNEDWFIVCGAVFLLAADGLPDNHGNHSTLRHDWIIIAHVSPVPLLSSPHGVGHALPRYKKRNRIYKYENTHKCIDMFVGLFTFNIRRHWNRARNAFYAMKIVPGFLEASEKPSEVKLRFDICSNLQQKDLDVNETYFFTNAKRRSALLEQVFQLWAT